MKTVLKKVGENLFKILPHWESSEEEAERVFKYLAGLKEGEEISCEIKKVRNLLFHKKYFALLKVGFDTIDTSGMEYRGEQITKNFESFRKDIAILCGFKEVVYSLNGKGFKLLAKSISFAKMDEQEFELLYNQTVNKLLERVLPKSYNSASLKQAVDQILNGFT